MRDFCSILLTLTIAILPSVGASKTRDSLPLRGHVPSSVKFQPENRASGVSPNPRPSSKTAPSFSITAHGSSLRLTVFEAQVSRGPASETETTPTKTIVLTPNESYLLEDRKAGASRVVVSAP